MRKVSAKRMRGELRPEYDLSQLEGSVWGEYYKQATAGTNLVLIESDLVRIFPDTESVNRALRLLVDTAEAAAACVIGARRLKNSLSGSLKTTAA